MVLDMSSLRSLVTKRLCVVVNLVTKKSYLLPTSLQIQHSQPHYKYVSYQNFGWLVGWLVGLFVCLFVCVCVCVFFFF